MSYYNTNQEEINQDATEIKLTDVMRNSGSISVNKDLIRFMNEGSNTGLIRATVLTEIISKYEMWKDKGDLQKDGSFFYTADEIENDTGISSYTQRTSVFPYLESLGLLKRESRRHPDNPMKKVRFIKLDVKACIKLFEEVIPKFKEKAEKSRHDAMVENQPSEQLKINHPNGRKSTSSNTVLNNTKLNNTKYINQSSKEYNSNIDKQPRKKKEPNRLTEHDIQNTNLPMQIQKPLVMYLENVNSNQISINQIMEMYQENKQRMDDISLGNVLYDVLRETRKINNFIKYVGKSVNNRLEEQEKQNDHQSSEVIPEWFEEQKRQRGEAQRKKESSYQSDYSMYDFSGKVLGNKSWLPDYDEPKENQ